MNKDKKLLIILSITLGVVLIGLVWLLISQRNKSLLNNPQIEEPSTSTITSLQTSATATAAAKTATPTVTPTPEPTKSADELIENALYQKFSKDSSSLTFSIGKKSDNAAYGTLTFTDEGQGGYFVAAKDSEGSWKIIADGNGTIECSILDQYNVPASVVGQCYDSSSQESKTR